MTWQQQKNCFGSFKKVLGLVQYGINDLARRMKKQFDQAIKDDRLKPNEDMRLLNEYEKALKEYTYLDLKWSGQL